MCLRSVFYASGPVKDSKQNHPAPQKLVKKTAMAKNNSIPGVKTQLFLFLFLHWGLSLHHECVCVYVCSMEVNINPKTLFLSLLCTYEYRLASLEQCVCACARAHVCVWSLIFYNTLINSWLKGFQRLDSESQFCGLVNTTHHNTTPHHTHTTP